MIQFDLSLGDCVIEEMIQFDLRFGDLCWREYVINSNQFLVVVVVSIMLPRIYGRDGPIWLFMKSWLFDRDPYIRLILVHYNPYMIGQDSGWQKKTNGWPLGFPCREVLERNSEIYDALRTSTQGSQNIQLYKWCSKNVQNCIPAKLVAEQGSLYIL